MFFVFCCDVTEADHSEECMDRQRMWLVLLKIICLWATCISVHGTLYKKMHIHCVDVKSLNMRCCCCCCQFETVVTHIHQKRHVFHSVESLVLWCQVSYFMYSWIFMACHIISLYMWKARLVGSREQCSTEYWYVATSFRSTVNCFAIGDKWMLAFKYFSLQTRFR